MSTKNEGLGEFEYEYDTNQIGRYFGLIIGIGFIGGGIYVGILAARTSEPVIWILIGIVVIVLIILGIFLIRRFMNNRGGSIKLYKNGLDVTINGKNYIGNWNDFEIVQEFITENRVNGIHASTSYAYFARLKNGEYFLLDQTFFGVKEIGARLCNETFERFYPKFSKQIERGEKVKFGEIYADSSGLTVNNKPFLWSYISDFVIEDGVIKIKDKNGKKAWEEIYANIPNAHIFIAILKDFIKKHNYR